MVAVAKPPPKRIGGLSGLPPKVQRRSKKAKPNTAVGPTSVFNCCDDPDPHDEDGVKICRNCFTELSNVNIAAEVTFEDQAGGRSTVQGGLVGENARFSKTLGAGAYRRIGGGASERNSIAEIENAGRRALANLAAPLKVPDNITQQAASVWSLAALNNFMAGRKTDEVAAACMWAACRRQKDNDVLLLDMAEILRINVFRLGEVYKDLCEKLYLAAKPVGYQHFVEMEPLIKKYCQKLQFGDQTDAVGHDALRIMKRMNRDWIVSGRHPAGLCGACIILAARMNNFQRSVREIVYVSKVADITIAKRVLEFRRTKSAALTVEQFRAFGNRMTHQHDPPSLHDAERRQQKLVKQRAKRAEYIRQSVERLSQQRASVIDISDGDSDDVSIDEEHVSAGNAAELPTPPATQSQSSQSDAGNPQADGKKRALEENALVPAEPTKRRRGSKKDSTSAASIPKENAAKKRRTSKKADAANDVASHERQQTSEPGSTQQSASPQGPRIDADGFVIPDLPLDPRLTAQEVRGNQSGKPGRKPKHKTDPPPILISDEELADENYLEDQITQMLEAGQVEDAMNAIAQTKAQERFEAEAARAKLTAAEQQRLEAAANQQRRADAGVDGFFGDAPSPTSELVTAEALEAEFRHDVEVARCLLTPDEVRTKEQIWLTHNEDWLRKQAEKDMLAAVARATGIARGGGGAGGGAARGRKGGKKRSKLGDRSVLTDRDTPVESPADAAKAMLDKRAPLKSQHVDFATLERIYGRSSVTPSRDESGEGSPSGTAREGSVEGVSDAGDQWPAGTAEQEDGGEQRRRVNANRRDEEGAIEILEVEDSNDARPIPYGADTENNGEDDEGFVVDEEEDPEEAAYRDALDSMQFGATETDEFGEVPPDYGDDYYEYGDDEY